MLTLNDFEISDQLLFRRLGNPGITYQTLATELGISKQAIQKQINKAASRYTSLQKEKNRTALSLLELKQQIEKHKYLITRLQRQLVVNSTNHLVISCFNSKLKKLAPRWTGPRLDQHQKLQILTNYSKFASLGGTLREFCAQTHHSVESITEWRRRYERHGINGLINKTTRPKHFRKILNHQTKDATKRTNQLIEILHDKPKSYGINRSNWTQGSLSLAYEKQFQGPINKSTISRLLKKRGYTLKKARRVLTSPDPDYRSKVELLLQTLRNLSGDQLLFFIDEMGPLRVKRYGGRIIVHRRDHPTFPQIQPHKGSITMSAALSATTNQVTWLYTPAKDTRAMIDLVEILFNQYHAMRTIYITWDAASWHSSAALLQWLDKFNFETERLGKGPVIHLVPLPSSSQFLDVLEAVFSGMKRAVVHHSDYNDKIEMKCAISRHFVERNDFFINNPKRAGNKIWSIDFFDNQENLKSGDYREW